MEEPSQATRLTVDVRSGMADDAAATPVTILLYFSVVLF
jgi:hypothetical protein